MDFYPFLFTPIVASVYRTKFFIKDLEKVSNTLSEASSHTLSELGNIELYE